MKLQHATEQILAGLAGLLFSDVHASEGLPQLHRAQRQATAQDQEQARITRPNARIMIPGTPQRR